MRKRNIVLSIILSVILLIILVAGLAALWPRKRPHSQVQRLPNGSLLSLEAVSYGDKVTIGSKVFDALQIEAGNKDVLSFCFSLSGGSWKPYLCMHDAVLDEHGCWISYGSGWHHTLSFGKPLGPWLDVGAEREIEVITVTAFPRRGQSVILRLFGKCGEEDLGEFIAPNPTPGPHPIWTPESLPIKKQDGNLTFLLTGLTTGSDYMGRRIKLAETPLTRASFRITENGKLTKDWAPVQIVISDATGNLLTHEIPSPLKDESHYKNGEAVINFNKMLCADETWKLRVEFTQTPGSQFPADQLWALRGLGIPANDTVVFSNEATVKNGCTLRLLGIGGPGVRRWRLNSATSSKDIEVRARLSLPCENIRLNLLATDDHGRKFIGSITGYSDIAGDNEREFSFNFSNLPSDARTLDLTFAISTSRYAEYLVKPSVP